jgi:SAM-dependent methyltransferase
MAAPIELRDNLHFEEDASLEPPSHFAQDAPTDVNIAMPKVKPRQERAVAKLFPEMKIAGFSRLDGGMNFHGFVNALLRPEMVVVDFGAGRGAGLEFTEAPYRTTHCAIRGKVAKVIGVDIDPIVKRNPTVDEAILIEPGRPIPLEDNSVDLIVSVATFEHITDPDPVQREFLRILRPGGWVCVMTPNKYGYIAIGARIVPNSLHKRVLRWMQPQRLSIDVFPTAYKLNTRAAVRRHFGPDDWEVTMFPWSNEPCYMEDNPLAVRLLSFAGKHMPNYFQLHWHIFMRKRMVNS